MNVLDVINVKYKYLFEHNVSVNGMTSLTLSIPKELRRLMDKHPEINWSEVARQSIIQKLNLLEKMDRLLSKSKLTEKDAVGIGARVNKGIAKRMAEKE